MLTGSAFKELAEKRDKLRRFVRYHLEGHFQRDKAETEAAMERDIRHAKMILSLDRAMTKVERFLNTQRPRQGKGKRSKEVKSNLTDNVDAGAISP